MQVVQAQLNTQIERAEKEMAIIEVSREETAKKLQKLGQA
jgi:hypothetical protein